MSDIEEQELDVAAETGDAMWSRKLLAGLQDDGIDECNSGWPVTSMLRVGNDLVGDDQPASQDKLWPPPGLGAGFAAITALAAPDADWPGNRLKELRNSFFHYLRLDKAAADVQRLPLQRGLTEAADHNGQVIIESGGPLNGIRALFADEVLLNALTADYEEGEMERLAASFANYQPALNRFAQAALGRYLREFPEDIVQFEGPGEEP